MSGRNLGASVRAKLLNTARAEKRDFGLVLTRYALERLLYRLTRTFHQPNDPSVFRPLWLESFAAKTR